MKQENDRRLEKSINILKKSFNHTNLYDQSADFIGITIVTISRNGKFPDGYNPRYPTQVVGTLLEMVNTSRSRLKYNIYICNVDSNPDSYQEVIELGKMFKVFQKFKDVSPDSYDVFEKEKEDYVFCMQETLRQNASSVFMIEDDAYPHADLMTVLENLLTERDSSTVRNLTEVAYLKFYHPERLLGYVSLEVERLPELVSVGVVFGTMLTLFFVKYVRLSERYDFRLLWVLFVSYVCLIALTVGRVNLIELRRLSTSLYQLTPVPSCCTQAMLFPAHAARSFIKHLNSITCKHGFAKDIALEFIRERENYDALMVQPNLFFHNGLYSTVRHRMIDPFLLE